MKKELKVIALIYWSVNYWNSVPALVAYPGYSFDIFSCKESEAQRVVIYI